MRLLFAFVWAVTLMEVPLLAQNLAGGSDRADLSAWRAIAVLLFLALLCAAAWCLVRRAGGTLPLWQGRHARQIEVLEVARVAPQASLCLARMGDKEFLIAFTAQGATLIETRLVAEKSA